MNKQINDLKEEWKGRSPIVKLVLLVGFVVATSSIASLSDAVFKWKGFILEGIEFYQVCLRNPLREAFEWIGLRFSANESDILVISFATSTIPWRIRGEGKAPKIINLLTQLSLFLVFGFTESTKGAALSMLMVPAGYACFIWFQYPNDRIRLLLPMIAPWVIICVVAAVNEGLVR